MNRMKWFFLLIGVAGLIFASWACERTSAPNSATIEENGIEYHLQTDRGSYRLGESVNISFRVTNQADEPGELGTVINCDYCICKVKITLNDKDIWKNCRVPPPCGQKMFQLNAHESREYTVTWKMINDNGTLEPEDDYPTGKGTYKVVAELMDKKVSVVIEIK